MYLLWNSFTVWQHPLLKLAPLITTPLSHLMDTPYILPSPHGGNPSSFTKSASSKCVWETLNYWWKKPGCKTELTIIKACQFIAYCLNMWEPDGSCLVNKRVESIFEEMKMFFTGRKTQLGEHLHLWLWIQLILCSRLCWVSQCMTYMTMMWLSWWLITATFKWLMMRQARHIQYKSEGLMHIGIHRVT